MKRVASKYVDNESRRVLICDRRQPEGARVGVLTHFRAREVHTGRKRGGEYGGAGILGRPTDLAIVGTIHGLTSARSSRTQRPTI